MTRRLIAGLVATLLVVAVNAAHSTPETSHTPRACARRLHIAWDRADGATERLTAFSACVGGDR